MITAGPGCSVPLSMGTGSGTGTASDTGMGAASATGTASGTGVTTGAGVSAEAAVAAVGAGVSAEAAVAAVGAAASAASAAGSDMSAAGTSGSAGEAGTAPTSAAIGAGSCAACDTGSAAGETGSATGCAAATASFEAGPAKGSTAGSAEVCAADSLTGGAVGSTSSRAAGSGSAGMGATVSGALTGPPGTAVTGVGADGSEPSTATNRPSDSGPAGSSNAGMGIRWRKAVLRLGGRRRPVSRGRGRRGVRRPGLWLRAELRFGGEPRFGAVRWRERPGNDRSRNDWCGGFGGVRRRRVRRSGCHGLRPRVPHQGRLRRISPSCGPGSASDSSSVKSRYSGPMVCGPFSCTGTRRAGVTVGPRSASDRTTPPVASGIGGPRCRGLRTGGGVTVVADGGVWAGARTPPRSTEPVSRPPVWCAAGSGTGSADLWPAALRTAAVQTVAVQTAGPGTAGPGTVVDRTAPGIRTAAAVRSRRPVRRASAGGRRPQEDFRRGRGRCTRRAGDARLLHHACVLRQSLTWDLAGVGHAYPSPIHKCSSSPLPGRPY